MICHDQFNNLFTIPLSYICESFIYEMNNVSGLQNAIFFSNNSVYLNYRLMYKQQHSNELHTVCQKVTVSNSSDHAKPVQVHTKQFSCVCKHP